METKTDQVREGQSSGDLFDTAVKLRAEVHAAADLLIGAAFGAEGLELAQINRTLAATDRAARGDLITEAPEKSLSPYAPYADPALRESLELRTQIREAADRLVGLAVDAAPEKIGKINALLGDALKVAQGRSDVGQAKPEPEQVAAQGHADSNDRVLVP